MADIMEQSILTSVKKVLGIPDEYTVFDEDVCMHINSAFSTLTQLGVGPADGFTLDADDTPWTDFTGDVNEYNAVKTYVFLRVRLLFDPPTTSYLIGAFDQQIKELEWRLNVKREETAWVDPDPSPIGGDNGY